MATKRNEIIIDFEFTGLIKYDYVPEIWQIKMKNLTNGKSICKNFKTSAKLQKGALLRAGFETGNSRFSKKEFEKLLKEIGGTIDDVFIGFSINTDKILLGNAGIILEKYKDLQWSLTATKHEKAIAFNGRSMETIYCTIFGEFPGVTHNGEEELAPLERLYNINKTLKHKDVLKFYPFGDMAGMPLDRYVVTYRRKADGYRYNNNDILSRSLDYFIYKDQDFFDDDEDLF